MAFVTLDVKDNSEIRDPRKPAVLKVVGVGGGGCNAIESMIKRGLEGVEYIAVNTDAQVLEYSSANKKIRVGDSVTKGLGAGANPEIGKEAVEEDRSRIQEVLKGSDMVFITAGMGGGTGTGGAPVIASIAKSLGSVVVGIVTTPFRWEGKKRKTNSEQGINDLRQHVDSLIVVPNHRLIEILEDDISAGDAFDKPNEILYEATRGIAEIITVAGKINVDFADVKSVIQNSGDAMMGCGVASGENRAVEAAKRAISSSLLEGIDIKGAENILLNITSSENFKMRELEEANEIIHEAAGEEVNVIFGWVCKPEMNDKVSYTVIATGFNKNKVKTGPIRKVNNSANNIQPMVKKSNKQWQGFYNVPDENPVDYDKPTYLRMQEGEEINKSKEQKIPDIWNDSVDRESDSSADFLKQMMD